ncbi:MAG: FecR domain-containing protein [Burkholderiales bacterium]|nr:FecR domain-containing protein [Burkholderiales bacterium]
MTATAMVAWAAAALPAGLAGDVVAQAIGDVEYIRGAGAAQRAGERARVLGQGSPIEAGEVLTTGTNSFAVVKLNDGTRMTLRPNTAMKVDEFVLEQPGRGDNLVMNLLKGGLRVVTGVISKRTATSRLVTSTATVGIRGTDFDARICDVDCRAEARRPATPLAQASAATVVPATARVVQIAGTMTAVSESGERRQVVAGGPAYRGDTLETPAGAQAILVFRDDTRVTVAANTRVRIDEFSYDARSAADGSFALGLLKGGIRAVTGLIARARPASVRFTTATATVGIRGTDLHMRCEGAGAGEPGAGAPVDGCFIGTLQGEVAVTSRAAPAETVVVPAGATAQVLGTDRPAMLLTETPALMRDNPLPSPVQVPADLQQLFGSAARAEPEAGDLFVYLRDGHLSAEAGGRTLDIGRGEGLFVDAAGRTLARLDTPPAFLVNDPTPRPDRIDSRGAQLLDLQALGMRTRANLVCKP